MAKIAFSIEGEYISDVARLELLQGNYQGALRLLQCVNDLSLEQQIAILKGESYLTGSDCLTLEKDQREASKDYRKKLSEQYSTAVKFQDHCYRPYALVNSWCQDDTQTDITSQASYEFTKHFDAKAFEDAKKDTHKKEGHPYSRSLHYADDPQEDVATMSPEGVILWKKITVPYFLESLLLQEPPLGLSLRGADMKYPDNPEIYRLEELYTQDDTMSDMFDEKLLFIENLQKAIATYADNDKEYGWKTITDCDGRSLRVPGRAFLHYAMSHCPGVQIPSYQAFSPVGIKMMNDSAIHSDCWIGAGLDIYKAYDHKDWQNKLFIQAASDYQKSHFNYKFHLLSRGGLSQFKGITCNHENYQNIPKGQRILVIPHLGIEFEQAALSCDAIICEQGGPMAHLVIVGRECKKNYPIIRVDNACIKFCGDNSVAINFLEGSITSHKKLKKSEDITDISRIEYISNPINPSSYRNHVSQTHKLRL